MATAKAIKKRRQATRNIHKITKTMELVATAKLKSARQGAAAIFRYQQKLAEIISNLVVSAKHPLLEESETDSRITLFAITGNRGLCGSYNSKLVEEVVAFKKEMQQLGKKLDIWAVGRKGIQQLKFSGVELAKSYPHFKEQPTLEDVTPLAQELVDCFQSRTTDAVWTIYSHKLKIRRRQILPIAKKVATGDVPDNLYINLPDDKTLLAELLPQYFSVNLLQIFIEAAVSEQTSRMLAMKSATDNAEEMIKLLTRQYNRARQAQITRELLEILAGASAIN